MDPTKDDIRFVETPSTNDLMPTPITWETWVIIGAALFAIALLCWLIQRSRRPKPASPEDIHKTALKEAIVALENCPTEQRTPAATECC